MKSVLLIFFMFFSLFAEDLTLVGLSGNRYKIPYSSDAGVNVQKLFKSLYFAYTLTGDTLRVKNAGHSAMLIANKSTIFLDGKVQGYTISVTKSEGQFWAECSNISKLLDAISAYSFEYIEASKELSVHRSDSSIKVKSATEPKIPSVTAPTKPKVGGGIVVIDPGHGGKDPGAVGYAGTYEKNIVLKIAQKTARYIRDNSDLSVYLTREGDTFIPLRERTTYANSRHADLFVSIHCNAADKNDSVGGYKIYFLSDAKNSTDERIAVFENAVMDLEESGAETNLLQSVLKDMINNEYLKESQMLAADIEKAFHTSVPTIKPLYTGVGQANFYVLNGAQMPSVLVETAFLSNKSEEKLLKDDAFQNKMATALGQSIIAFRKKQGKRHE